MHVKIIPKLVTKRLLCYENLDKVDWFPLPAINCQDGYEGKIKLQ